MDEHFISQELFPVAVCERRPVKTRLLGGIMRLDTWPRLLKMHLHNKHTI